MELLLIRHALPLRIEHADGTPADPPLAPDGHLQAERLASWMRGQKVDALYSSPLLRALETAAPLATVVGRAIERVEEIAEFDRDASRYVPLEELTRDELREAAANAIRPPTGELLEFRDRAIAAVARIASENPTRRVAVVCHGGVINAFAGFVLGVDSLFVFPPDYTSISRFMVSRTGVRSVLSLNETPHLA